WMKRLERVRLLAHADKLERLAGDGANRECRAAARITVHLGENRTSDAEPLVELVRGFDRGLSGHRVGNEENFGGVEKILESRELSHELLVNVQAAGGVHEEDVAAGLNRFLARGPREVERLGFLRRAFVNRKLQILGEDAQLLSRRGTINVHRNHERRIAVL